MEEFTFSAGDALSVVIRDTEVSFLPKIRFFILPNSPRNECFLGAGQDEWFSGAVQTILFVDFLEGLVLPSNGEYVSEILFRDLLTS